MITEKEFAEVKLNAEKHWKFLEKWLHQIFVDGFVHGWKHALENQEKVKPE